jgi:hypothetical protein
MAKPTDIALSPEVGIKSDSAIIANIAKIITLLMSNIGVMLIEYIKYAIPNITVVVTHNLSLFDILLTFQKDWPTNLHLSYIQLLLAPAAKSNETIVTKTPMILLTVCPP